MQSIKQSFNHSQAKIKILKISVNTIIHTKAHYIPYIKVPIHPSRRPSFQIQNLLISSSIHP